MRRSPLARRLARMVRAARLADHHGISSRQALETLSQLERDRLAARRAGPAVDLDRRRFLAGAGGIAGAAALGSLAGPLRPLLAAPKPPPVARVAVVGAGLAGLSCAYELAAQGIRADVYEASERAGGRCWSLGGAFPGPIEFPGQVVERGGELIDNLHKSMLAYARELRLELEDLEKLPGEVFYHFGGQLYPEAVVVDEYRAFVPAMHADLRTLSNEITADSHTPADALLDQTNLAEYLVTRGAGSLIRAVLDVTYNIEYGLEIDEQSCLALLLFIHADRRSKFKPFGIFSDERYHVVGGNQQIPAALAAALPGQIRYGHSLLRVARTPAGAVELTHAGPGGTVTATYDHAVLALPFSILAGVELDPSLELPDWKLSAIQDFAYGTNAKQMIGFDRPFWRGLGSNGASYSDLPHHQTTWETNPSRAGDAGAVLTDYSGGHRGANLDPGDPQGEAARFLGDLELIWPGALATASRDGNGDYLVHLEHWPSSPFIHGSYSANRPGYFTTIAGNEGKPVANLHFAGEHTDSFYDWQGFMEGGVNSGIRAAGEILRAVKKGALAGPLARARAAG